MIRNVSWQERRHLRDTTPRRFLDKLNMTGSAAQVVNGVALLATFAGVRLIYGTYMVR